MCINGVAVVLRTYVCMYPSIHPVASWVSLLGLD